ncbi:MAG: methyltransferase [Bifidobacteriaceae bacterium]|nr:methyltransferase [Bifidobacteriaceae bacterium]
MSHYFSLPDDLESHEITTRMLIGAREFTVTTDAGVFSPKRVDSGTKELLGNLPDLEHNGDMRILDLGSGWGAISLYLASTYKNATVYAVDSNVRALHLTKKNALNNDLHNIVTDFTETASEELTFDYIISNPPIKIGKKPLQTLLLRYFRMLTPNGSAYIVINKNLGADSLAKWLTENDYSVTKLSSAKGYRVFHVRKLTH